MHRIGYVRAEITMSPYSTHSVCHAVVFFDSYVFDVREYLSECLELFDNKKVFGSNENFKCHWLVF